MPYNNYVILSPLSDRMDWQTHVPANFNGVTNPITESKLDDVLFEFDDMHIYDDPDTLRFIGDNELKLASEKTFCRVSADPSAMNAPQQESDQEKKNSPGYYQTPSSIPASNAFEFECHTKFEPSSSKPSTTAHLSPDDPPKGATPDRGKECSVQEGKATKYMPLLHSVERVQTVENDYESIPSAGNGSTSGAPVSCCIPPVANVEDQYIEMSTPKRSPHFN